MRLKEQPTLLSSVVLALLVGCPRSERVERPTANQPESSARARVRDAGCRSDLDCPTGSLCACTQASCSVDPGFFPQFGSPEGFCFDRKTRLGGGLPIRVDGGWMLESDPTAKVYESVEAAWGSTLPPDPEEKQ
jgi:hypothetical protein